MEVLNQFLEILKYILPSVVVFLTAYYVLKHFMQIQLRKEAMEIRARQQKDTNPIRLQAYERMVLFLERITPSSLIMRLNKEGLSASQFHQELLSTIRAEYEHNLTQQIYISNASWEAVRRAKEETVKLINVSASKINGDAKAIELGKFILEMSMQVEKLPTQLAIDFLKEEVKTLF